MTEKECNSFLDKMFPQGFTGQDVKDEIIPNGWERSALKAVFHPSVEQAYEEYVQREYNIRKVFKNKEEDNDTPIFWENFDEFKTNVQDTQCDPERELLELIGLCVWDLFSDNHEVIATNGKTVDLGSSRGSAGFIAAWIGSKQEDLQRYNYMDFYLGTQLISHRANLTPVYRMIFRRLNQMAGDWVYSFPRLYLLRPSKTEDQSDSPENYDPAQSIEREFEEKEEERKHKKLKEDIEQMNREAMEEASQKKPPRIVIAYTDIYGQFPQGWPPEPI